MFFLPGWSYIVYWIGSVSSISGSESDSNDDDDEADSHATMVIWTDCTGSCKSNYHTIKTTTTTASKQQERRVLIPLSDLIPSYL
jgi:hypothetical protein